MKGELMQAAQRETEKADRLRKAAARQIATGERTMFEMEVGGDYVSITDKRLVITKLGSVLGERAESIPLGAITGIATHVTKDKVIIIQLAVPGRSWGELSLTGEDLGPVLSALVGCLPSYNGAP